MLLNKKIKYLAAVSGGPDSMALLDRYKQYIVGVCHVNYHKSIDSDNDTKIVKEYCLRNNISLFILDVKKDSYINADQHNFQALARLIRYNYFVECSKKIKCNSILVAHNLNDFLETALMQEKRNSLNFYYGIRPISKYKNLTIYRPLLNKFKDELEQYCIKNNISYAIDSSNSQEIYERNRVRKQINLLSKKEQKTLYKKFQNRNFKIAILEKDVLEKYSQWEKTNFSVKFIKDLKQNKQILSGIIYIFYKKYNILNINHNKINMTIEFILADKSNQMLRLENNIKLFKKDKKVKIIKNYE